MARQKAEITSKRYGLSYVVIIKDTIDGEEKSTKYSTKLNEESAEELKRLIGIYNKLKRKSDIDAIIDLMSPIKKALENEKIVLKSEKKLIQKKAKEPVKAAKAIKAKVIKSNDPNAKLLKVTKEGMCLVGFEEITMPKLLQDKINEYLEAKERIEALINFWMLCLLNPNPIARTKLFDYLSKQKLILTPSGYFVTYRMVKTTDKPNVFKSNHSNPDGSYMHYKVGDVVSMPREACDEDGSKDCSRGLHTGTPRFIGIITKDEINKKEGNVGEGYGTGEKTVTSKSYTPDSYGTGYDRPSFASTETQKFDNSYGNQAIITLINPAHVVSVPDSDTRKMRSCEFYFCKLTTPEEVIELNNKEYLIFDHNYKKIEQKQIQELLKNKIVKKFIDTKEGGKVTKSIKEINAQIEDLNKQGKIRMSSDKLSSDLDLNQLRQIINTRTKLVKSRK